VTGSAPPLGSPPAIIVVPADQAASTVRRVTSGLEPILVPGWVPAGMLAHVRPESDGGYALEYLGSGDQRRILLAICVCMAGLPSDHSSQSQVQFRGVSAFHQVGDTRVPGGDRLLQWREPDMRSTVLPPYPPGIEYELLTQGLSEADFWSVANSLS
jgi:hypothetical protein